MVLPSGNYSVLMSISEPLLFSFMSINKLLKACISLLVKGKDNIHFSGLLYRSQVLSDLQQTRISDTDSAPLKRTLNTTHSSAATQLPLWAERARGGHCWTQTSPIQYHSCISKVMSNESSPQGCNSVFSYTFASNSPYLIVSAAVCLFDYSLWTLY